MYLLIKRIPRGSAFGVARRRFATDVRANETGDDDRIDAIAAQDKIKVRAVNEP